MCSWRGTPVRINYNLTVALTGRMSSSGSKGNDYYKPLNGQNLPKIEIKAYLHTHPVLGYCLTDEADGAVCDASGNPIKYKTKAGMRSAFLPAPAGEDGWAVLGADYCVHPDTLITTIIGDIPVKSLIGCTVDVLTPYGYKRASGFHYTGRRRQVRLELTDGSVLICSPDHRLWIRRGCEDMWCPAGNLLATDYVYTLSDATHPVVVL